MYSFVAAHTWLPVVHVTVPVAKRDPASSPVPPRPEQTMVARSEPEIIHRSAPSPASGMQPRRPMATVPRSLLDEAAAVAVERQRLRRERMLWLLGGSLVAIFLLFSHLRTRTVPRSTPALGNGSPAQAAEQAPNVEAPEAKEAAPIDIDEDERVSALPTPARKAGTERVNAAAGDPPSRTTAGQPASIRAASKPVAAPTPSQDSASKQRAWFSEN